jgi:hypothetical protein
LIAKTKSRAYQENRLIKYYNAITSNYKKKSIPDCFDKAHERLQYWYSRDQYNTLAYIKKLILEQTPENSDYRLFFLCAFSNILKAASVWLTKSIKPQVDPGKIPLDPYVLFTMQCDKMLKAVKEAPKLGKSSNLIITGSFLDETMEFPKTDMIITSPPYVTSYEYADLHQLSTIWLDFADDYKVLRNGTIGSMYHKYDYDEEKKKLNSTGIDIISKLEKKEKRKARSVAKYFLDMQKMAKNTINILNENALALFVIGNTEYKKVKIDNVRHLAESMIAAGYKDVSVSKRKISKKILTPYRDKKGKFTTNSKGRKVYSEEFILMGRK